MLQKQKQISHDKIERLTLNSHSKRQHQRITNAAGCQSIDSAGHSGGPDQSMVKTPIKSQMRALQLKPFSPNKTTQSSFISKSAYFGLPSTQQVTEKKESLDLTSCGKS